MISTNNSIDVSSILQDYDNENNRINLYPRLTDTPSSTPIPIRRGQVIPEVVCTTRNEPRTINKINSMYQALNTARNENFNLRLHLDLERAASNHEKEKTLEMKSIIQNIHDLLFDNSEKIPCGLYVDLMNALVKK